MKNLILEWRKKLKLTQEELAEKIGRHIGTINNWENEKSKPKITTLRQVAEKLGIDPDDFIAGPETYKKINELPVASVGNAPPKINMLPTAYAGADQCVRLYALARIVHSLEATQPIGLKPTGMRFDNALDYIAIYIDHPNEFFFLGDTIYCALKRKPCELDYMLVYRPHMADIVRYNNAFDYPVVYGPVFR